MSLLRVLALALLVACGGKDDTADSSTTGPSATPPSSGTASATATATATGTGTGTGSTSGADCPWVGTWELATYTCDSLDITADYTARVQSTVMTITAEGGGCHVTYRFSSPGVCEEVEEWTWPDAVDGQVGTVQGLGITSCDPDGCTFDEDDAACLVGDRAGTRVGTLTLDPGVSLTLEHEGGDICGSMSTTVVFTPG